MTIGSLSGVGGVIQSQSVNNANAKLLAVISSIVSGQASGDVANVSLATQLQAQTAGLKQVSNNLVQGSSLTQVADGGVEQIQNALSQLQSIAQQSNSPILNSTDRTALNQQFSQLVNSISQIAASTSFNGQNLLNGSLSGSNALSLDSLLGNSGSGSGDLSIGNLGSSSLLAGVSDVLSADNAGQSLATINNALNQITGIRAAIGSFQQTLGFASANVDSAVANLTAANSTLSETDLVTASTQKTQDEVQRNAAIALAAQGNNLSPALLKLVG